MKVVATYSIKGGVGKTTTAVNLSHEAARSGARVLLWDLDPQGGATYLVRLKPFVKGGAERLASGKGELAPHVRASDVTGLEVVPADFSLRHLDLHLDSTKHPTRRLRALLEPLAGRYDLAILDCPPGISLSSESVFGAVDALLVPTVPSMLSRRTLDQLVGFLAQVHVRPMVLPFATMVDRRRRLHREVLDELVRDEPGFLPTTIPEASVIEQMGVQRAAVGAFAPTSGAAECYRHLWDDLAGRLWT